MRFNYYRYLIRSDLYRYAGKSTAASFVYNFLFYPGFKYSFWMRTCAYCKTSPLLRFSLFPIAYLMLNRYQYKFGISISYRTHIGPGLYIGHFGGIVINQKAVIGRNCNISHQVTIGVSNRGKRKGCPVIGDNVYIGPGAKVIGHITIGDNVAVGANCVVSDNVPESGVIVGIPGKVISKDGSAGYVNRTDYDGKIK